MGLKPRLALLLALALALPVACSDAGGDADADTDVDTDADTDTDTDTDPPAPFCPEGEDLTRYVDPLIGTDGQGNSTPGAVVPHGMVRLGPDTESDLGKVEPYEYNAEKIEGFSHTAWHGPGGSANGYSHVLIQPTAGAITANQDEYSSAFTHVGEQASPGYYAVTLTDHDIRVELTATGHAGIHRYTFHQGADPARVLIDLGHSLSDSKGGQVDIVDDHTIRGHGYYNVHSIIDLVLNASGGHSADSRVYFHAEFGTPFSGYGTWQGRGSSAEASPGSASAEGPWIGAYAELVTAPDEVVEVRVGISLISTDQAQANLEAEIGTLSFEEVRDAAEAAWNCHLNRVPVVGGSEAERTMFYTGLYHTLMQPADHTETGGVFFSAADQLGAVTTLDRGRRFYTDDWCAWDTFRTSRPLATLVEPRTVSDVVASYLHLYSEGGWLPKCTWQAAGYSRVMIGNHGVAIVADALFKGFDDYDLETAWAALYKSATDDNLEESPDALCGYANLGTPPEYIENGFVSHDCDGTQGASMTLEYAYNDWCIAQVAERLGRPEQEAAFRDRAQYYRNHWNPAYGFMQGRWRDGSWVEPFDPANWNDGSNDFCEATSWIYSWFVPHDVPGLIALMGGAQAFLARLDQFFAEGQFDVSNEPSFHIPFLYNYAGKPEKAQALIREILARDFNDGPNGLPGNDDAGATSAWYVFAALGLYPVAPGDGIYQIVSPVFERVTLELDPAVYDGERFVIEAAGASAENKYIISATLNGSALDRTWITHDEVVAGGTLVLELGDSPGN